MDPSPPRLSRWPAQDEAITALALKAGFKEGQVGLVCEAEAITTFRQISAFESLHAEIKPFEGPVKRTGLLAGQLAVELSALDARAKEVLRRYEPDLDLELFARLAELLGDASDTALAPLSTFGKGRPSVPQLGPAIHELYELYRQIPHAPRGITYKPDTKDGYSGEFYSLIRELFSLVGIRRSPQAIGKQIELVVRAFDTSKPPLAEKK